jgi:hypothetical protein
MPKIFITGSNESKGTKTGSGYLSNPTRVLIRDRDNQGGKLPTKVRVGTKDRPGNELTSYDDNNSIRYGRTISDTFTFIRSSNLSKLTNPQSNIWSTSPGIKIKRQNNVNARDYDDGALVFSGPGDVSGRWIQTKEKVRNPTLILTIFQGPYLENTDKLDLSQGQLNENLKIQISETGSGGWINAAINDNNVSNPSFIIDGVITPSFNNSEIRNPGNLNILRTNRRRPLCKVKLDMQSFKLPNNSFYIRIIQENIADESKSIWAINDIKIISRNDSVTYPFLLKEDFGSHKKFITGSLSTPNFPGALTTIGVTHKPVVNSHFSPKSFEENINSFNDNSSFDFTEDFYQEGTDPSVYPGFGSNLSSKLIFDVDLTPSEESEFGITNKISNNTSSGFTDTSKTGQNLMVYWNNNLKRWEKIGKPVHYGNVVSPSDSTILEMLTSSCVGFGPHAVISKSGSNGGVGSQAHFIEIPQSKDVISFSNKKISNFLFPFGHQYYATSSQHIKAKDIGITKPIIAEKFSLEFNAKFEFPGRDDFATGPIYAYALNAGSPTTTQPSGVQALNIDLVVPTFFMLRQFKDTYSEEYSSILDRTSSTIKSNISIPSRAEITTNNSETYIEKNRDMISYGQLGMFLSSSRAAGAFNLKIEESRLAELSELKTLGFSYDSYFYQSVNTQDIPSVTGSFKIEFPARITNRIEETINSIYLKSSAGGDSLRLKNEFASSNQKFRNERRVVNGVGSYSPRGNTNIPGGAPANDVIDVAIPEQGITELMSPYIIMPEDELIFGWQYPMPRTLVNKTPGNDFPDIFWKMTLFDNAKLKIFGSLIKNNKEKFESLNQYLTSDSVYETIGNDSILDQFQLATRGELTGSILSEVFTSEGSNSGAGDAAVFGGLIFPNFVLGNESFKRIGSLARSSTHDSFNLLNDYGRGLAIKNSFNIQASDLQRKFSDCFLVSADKAQDYEGNNLFSGDDGAFIRQGYGFIPSIVSSPASNSTGKYEYYSISPQYSFNSSHFGYFSDLIQQGKDSKFVNDDSTAEDDLVTESPIQVTFVKSEIIDNTTFKRFRKYDQGLISGTSELEFQSLNLDINSKSNSAFYDDGVIRDRVYNKDTTTVS